MTVGVAAAAYRPISLFSIYAPEDVSLHEQLERHLSSLKRQGLITLWSLDNTTVALVEKRREVIPWESS